MMDMAEEYAVADDADVSFFEDSIVLGNIDISNNVENTPAPLDTLRLDHLNENASFASISRSSQLTSVSRVNSNLSSSETSHMPKRRKTDPVWDYIDEVSSKCYCRLCRKEYLKEMGITTIKTHFKLKHPEKWNEVFAQTVQFPVVEPYGKKDSAKVARLMQRLTRWIITDQQAFSVVEHQDFRAFIAELDPRFQLPTRQTVSENITKAYNQQQENVRALFSKTTHKFALTTDA